MPIKYFATTWRDLTQSKGWFLTLIKMTLLHLIPIFGQLVGYGYKYAWGREAAWHMYNPLPKSIFTNTDGNLYVRGGLTFLYMMALLYALRVVDAIFEVVSSTSYLLAVPALIVSLLVVVLTVAIYFGAMHIALYNKFSAGFSFLRFSHLYKRDPSGVWRLVGFYFLASIVVSLILSFVVVAAVIMWAFIGGEEVVSDIEHFVRHMVFFDGYSALMIVAESSMAFRIGLAVVSFIILLAALFLTQITEVLLIRGIGYWFGQFNIASWGGPNDPLPLEQMMPTFFYQQDAHNDNAHQHDVIADSEQGDVSPEAEKSLSDKPKD